MMTRCIVDVERDASMKNLSPKEAITILEGMRINTPLPKAAVMQSKRNAAIDMAIDTLKYSAMPNSSDSISRQAALGAIKRKLAEPAYQHAGEDWYVGMIDAESELLDLPSAQPENVIMINKETVLQAGYQGREVDFRIGGRLFAIREKAQ